tara:strand:+ start:851 stop:1174 length:324 start_codon:yes stop_codon:yes gene_type:complete
MGKLNKFYYAKADAKKDILLAAHRISGFQNHDANNIVMHFNSLANPGDATEGRAIIPITGSKFKEFVEDISSVASRKPFVELVDDQAGTSASSHYTGGDASISSIVS